jgi:hypothetical protein
MTVLNSEINVIRWVGRVCGGIDGILMNVIGTCAFLRYSLYGSVRWGGFWGHGFRVFIGGALGVFTAGVGSFAVLLLFR